METIGNKWEVAPYHWLDPLSGAKSAPTKPRPLPEDMVPAYTERGPLSEDVVPPLQFTRTITNIVLEWK